MLLTFWCPISVPNKREGKSMIEKSNDHGGSDTEVHTRCVLALGVFVFGVRFVGFLKLEHKTIPIPPALATPRGIRRIEKIIPGGIIVLRLQMIP